MQIKEIKMQRSQAKGDENTVRINIKADFAANDNALHVEEIINRLLKTGLNVVRVPVVVNNSVRRNVFPSPDQWLELKKLVVNKIGTDEGDEIDSFIREETGMNRIDLLTSGKVQGLIQKLLGQKI